jgi:hypothetical protein
MTTFKAFSRSVLPAAAVSTLLAETHCRESVASVPFHAVIATR